MKQLLLILALTLQSYAAISCVSTKTHGDGVDSAPMDTTGKTILIAIASSYVLYNQVIHDSVGTRDWQTSSEYSDFGINSQNAVLLWKSNPVTSATYTFSLPSGPGLFQQSAVMLACSGVATNHPLLKQIGVLGTGSTWQPGSVTPYEAGDLIVAAGTSGISSSTTASINSGFSVPITSTSTTDLTSAVSWFESPNTSAVNPTWTTNISPWIGIIAVFRAAATADPVQSGLLIKSVVGTGHQDFGGDGAPAVNAFVNFPGEIVRTSNGLVCLADVNNNRIRCFNPTSGTLVAPWVGSVSIVAGNIATVAGSDTTVGFTYSVAPLSAKFAHPVGLAIDASDCLYIADQQNARIAKLCPGGNVGNVAGGGVGGSDALGCSTPGFSDPGAGYAGDGGAATAALLKCPQGVAVDAAGNIYIGDTNNNRVRVVNTQGTTQTILGVSICAGCIRTVLGDGTQFCTLTGVGTTTAVSWPIGMSLDILGNLFIGTPLCNSVWKLTTAGVPSSVAGNGTAGYTGDGGLATGATLRFPFRASVASNGDFYIADTNNGVVRFVNHFTGEISTVAGNYALFPYLSFTTWNGGGYCCDYGAANQAGLMYPIGLLINPDGGFYISDLANSRVRMLYPGIGAHFSAGVKFTSGVKVQ